MNSISKNKKEEMTMLKLGQMMTKGFLELGKKIDKLEKRMDRLEERTKRLEDSLTDARITMDRRLSSMEEKLEKGVDKILTIAVGMARDFSDWKQENVFSAGIESRQAPTPIKL